MVSRAFGLHTVATVLAWVTTALAGVGGAYLIQGTFPPRPDQIPVQVLTSAAFVVLAAGAMALWAQVSTYEFLAVALTALWILATTMVVVLAPHLAAHACAVALALALAITPLLPMLSFRLARVTMPNLPNTAEALMADRQPVQSDITHRAVTADRFLAALLSATSAAATLLAFAVATLASGWAPTALIGAVGLALLLRARAFTGHRHRLVLLTAGTVISLVSLQQWLVALPAGGPRTLAGLGVVVIAVWILTQYAATMYDRILSPVWGRFGDIFEWIAIIAILPLTLAVLDVYQWAYGLAG